MITNNSFKQIELRLAGFINIHFQRSSKSEQAGKAYYDKIVVWK